MHHSYPTLTNLTPNLLFITSSWSCLEVYYKHSDIKKNWVWTAWVSIALPRQESGSSKVSSVIAGLLMLFIPEATVNIGPHHTRWFTEVIQGLASLDRMCFQQLIMVDDTVTQRSLTFFNGLRIFKNTSKGRTERGKTWDIFSRVQSIYQFANGISQYWPITDILVLAYVFSNMSRY